MPWKEFSIEPRPTRNRKRKQHKNKRSLPWIIPRTIYYNISAINLYPAIVLRVRMFIHAFFLRVLFPRSSPWDSDSAKKRNARASTLICFLSNVFTHGEGGSHKSGNNSLFSPFEHKEKRDFSYARFFRLPGWAKEMTFAARSTFLRASGEGGYAFCVQEIEQARGIKSGREMLHIFWGPADTQFIGTREREKEKR